MFQDRLKPCAASDRCTLKPMLAHPQHKCPTCERHIHAICGVPNINARNLILIYSVAMISIETNWGRCYQ